MHVVVSSTARTGSSSFVKGGTVLSHRLVLGLAGPWRWMAPVLVLVLYKDWY